MQELWKVFDRLPFSLLLAAGLIVLLAWLFKTHGAWDSYRPLFHNHMFIGFTVFLLFNSLAFEVTRFLIANVGPKPISLVSITDYFQPAANRSENSSLESAATQTEASELILSFRILNTSSSESYELLRLDVENLGMLFRREPILTLDTSSQHKIGSYPQKEDLGVLIFSLYSTGTANPWLRLTQQLSFVPPSGGLRYPIPSGRALPILPLEQRVEIPPGRSIVMQIRMRCARSLPIPDDRKVITSGGWVCPLHRVGSYKITGFMTKPEYAFRLLLEAVSSRGERLRLSSDQIYSISPKPVSNFYGTILLREQEPKHMQIIEGLYLTDERVNQVDTLPIESWFAGNYELFLHRVIRTYVVLKDEAEQFQSVSRNKDQSSFTAEDVITDFCEARESSDLTHFAQGTQPSNVIEFLRELQKTHAETDMIITRLSKNSTLPQRDRFKASWLIGELRKPPIKR